MAQRTIEYCADGNSREILLLPKAHPVYDLKSVEITGPGLVRGV